MCGSWEVELGPGEELQQLHLAEARLRAAAEEVDLEEEVARGAALRGCPILELPTRARRALCAGRGQWRTGSVVCGSSHVGAFHSGDRAGSVVSQSVAFASLRAC